jgi:hypothetical protein
MGRGKERGEEMRKHILMIGGNEGVVNFRMRKIVGKTSVSEVDIDNGKDH